MMSELVHAPHVPVLLSEVVAALAPLDRALVVDATFGAGGYSRAILGAGAARVIGIDRDAVALSEAEIWSKNEPRLSLLGGTFSDMDDLAAEEGAFEVDAVVMDIGVSSMQLDRAERGFSFMRDGPLDMRMGGEGPAAADLVNFAPEAALADILYGYGEERAARRIARAIVVARSEARIETTGRLAEIVAGALPAARPGQAHPATRTFQALRIAVNDELGELVRGLEAAERLLVAGGRLAVVTFHSLEDRITKRFLSLASAEAGGSRHAAPRQIAPKRFERPPKAVAPSPVEIAANPRARSARLRVGIRTDSPPGEVDPRKLGLPRVRAAADILADAKRRTRRT